MDVIRRVKEVPMIDTRGLGAAAAGAARRVRVGRLLLGVCMTLGVGSLLGLDSARAATFEVTSSANSGSGSLREAITQANAGSDADVITFAPSITGNIAISAPMTISEPLTIDGPGADVLALDGGTTSEGGLFVDKASGTIDVEISGLTVKRIVEESPISNADENLTLRRVAVRNSLTTFVGGVLNNEGGDLLVDRSTISDIEVQPLAIFSPMAFGGGITNLGTLTLRNSTLWGNHPVPFGGGVAPLSGGGLYNGSSATATISSSTIALNVAQAGAGIANDGPAGSVRVANSIVGLNLDATSAPEYSPDCKGPVTSEGYNVVAKNDGCALTTATGDQVGTESSPVNPGLNPLGDNGGPTQTAALKATSVAMDAGNPATPVDGGLSGGLRRCEPFDQRGVGRPQGGRCDVGAYETEVAAPDPTAVDDAYTINEDSGPQIFRVRRNDLGDVTTVVSVTNPSHGTVQITNSGGNVTYTPDPDYCNPRGSLPDDTFTYTVNGGSTAAVSVRVRCVDDPPVAVDDAYTIRQGGTPSVFRVRRNDTDIDGGPMRVIATTDSAHATVTGTGAGDTVTYDPDPGYCNRRRLLPDDTFTYTLNGGSSATVSVWVKCA
jgi:hypothetical protein